MQDLNVALEMDRKASAQTLVSAIKRQSWRAFLRQINPENVSKIF